MEACFLISFVQVSPKNGYVENWSVIQHDKKILNMLHKNEEYKFLCSHVGN